MPKKLRRMRTFARTASKSMEKKLVENAQKVKEDPYLILPLYDDNYSGRIFNKLKKSLDRINRFSNDQDKLEKLAFRRGLDGALAGSILIANSQKAPYLAVAKFPIGDVTYAQRGRADKEKLIAIQHIDDPVLRILGIKDIAHKKRIHIYSWDEGFISSGLNAEPPGEFIKFVIKKTGFNYQNGVAICGDLKPDDVKNKFESRKNYLRIYWKSADLVFALCEDCAKEKKNTIFNITKYMLIPDISNDFIIDVVGHIVKRRETEPETTIKLDEYLSGGLSDYDFIKTNIKKREEALKDSGEKIFILDGESYGTNIDEFIKALKPNKYEKTGLEILLELIDEPVIVNNTTPNKVLERFWIDYGLDVITDLIDNKEMAKKFYDLDDLPSEIIQLAMNYKERQKVLSQLPSYKSLPSLAKFTDSIARTYKTFGEKEAIVEIKKRHDNPKAKSIAYAFLLALGKGTDKKWQYSPMEIEYGEFLKGYAKKLLDSKPENYHKNLQELLSNSGSSEDISDNLK
ncbi:MAG: hypothetical protein JSV67_04565 [Thermoplasmatales archaeon]|nr:MAG: hypothetical protein JSV67_04565 [Thermoplasmatales archaeon]